MASIAPPPVPPRPEAYHSSHMPHIGALENQTMLQGFEWYVPADYKHWCRLEGALPSLQALGITSLWIPPACKASWYTGNGYDIYDLYDLGEFEQKGSTHTKWGTKEELRRLVHEANARGIRVLFDAVLNHKAAADHSEIVPAARVDPKDRLVALEEPKPIEAWCRYDFPGRGSAHSPLQWNQNHFNGIDYDQRTQTKGVFKFAGREWAQDVDEELGNYDYLMFSNVDHSNPEVRRDLFYWISWLSAQIPIGGLRLDAIKHYSAEFLRAFVNHVDATVGRDWFIVGEYWREDSAVLAKYIQFMNHRLSLFDVRLVSNFSRLSMHPGADLRTVFDGSLVSIKPRNAVTFVANHDTMEGQSLETPVVQFFIPLAYALILLRADCGLPCVFYGHLYGHPKPDGSGFVPPPFGGAILPRMVVARKLYAYGPQIDYFDEPNCIGFTRLGDRSLTSAHSQSAGLAVVMTNGWTYATKPMFVGKQHAGQRWTDVLGVCWGEVVIDREGWGVFAAGPKSVAVWAHCLAPRRAEIDNFMFDHDIYGRGTENKPVTADDLYNPRLQTEPAWMQTTCGPSMPMRPRPE